MPFVNTRTSLGEQAAFDALVAHTLTELNEDGIYDLPTYALQNQENLVSINFPNVTTISDTSIIDNGALETIDIGSQCRFNGYPIARCSKLKALILRSTTGICTFGNYDPFKSTPFALMRAAIYVPRALIQDYLASSLGRDYPGIIKAIEDMPVTDLSTITHTWTQIKSMVDDESFFSSDYAIGDYKQFTYGEHTVLAEIIKIDSVNKYVDFVLKNIDETIKMNNTNAMVAYSNTLVKMRLDEIYSNELPLDLKTAISSISKKYYSYDGTTETVNAPLWLLNTKDVNFNGTYLMENEGEEYTTYNESTGRIKYYQPECDQRAWWLGSAAGSSSFRAVSGSGFGGSSSASNNSGLVFGFRIQKTT